MQVMVDLADGQEREIAFTLGSGRDLADARQDETLEQHVEQAESQRQPNQLRHEGARNKARCQPRL